MGLESRETTSIVESVAVPPRKKEVLGKSMRSRKACQEPKFSLDEVQSSRVAIRHSLGQKEWQLGSELSVHSPFSIASSCCDKRESVIGFMPESVAIEMIGQRDQNNPPEL